MGWFGRAGKKAAAVALVRCGFCGSAHVAMGAIDRVNKNVRYSCHDCGYAWRDGEVDLVAAERAAKVRALR